MLNMMMMMIIIRDHNCDSCLSCFVTQINQCNYHDYILATVRFLSYYFFCPTGSKTAWGLLKFSLFEMWHSLLLLAKVAS